MTIAQKLEQKGYQKGFLEGYQKGFIEGWQKGFQEGLQKAEERRVLKIASAMIDIGIDRETIMKATGLNQSELEQMSH